jgi:hypothetical protein
VYICVVAHCTVTAQVTVVCEYASLRLHLPRRRPVSNVWTPSPVKYELLLGDTK